MGRPMEDRPKLETGPEKFGSPAVRPAKAGMFSGKDLARRGKSQGPRS
jgi:hypothetical protein